MADPALIKQAPGKAGGGKAGARQLRDLWAIDQRALLVRLGQTRSGKLLLLALFCATAKLAGLPILFALVAAGFAYLPAYRNWIALAGAIVGLIRNPRMELEATSAILLQEGRSSASAANLGAAALIAYFACALAALLLVRRDKSLARRPVLSLIGASALLTGVGCAPWLHGLPRAAWWAFLSAFTAYLWFFAYALVEQRAREPAALPFQMGILHPFWGSFATPLGKGAAFLRKHQARTAEDLAVTQLKGLKLLVWALCLIVLNKVLLQVIEGWLGIPATELAYAAFMRGQPLPRAINWASLVWATLGGTLSLAIWGHKFIAVARLAGFRLPRNTWRPLEARTLADFWNRYYYYFKELLVEFFFFPTFLKAFRKHPRLRVFFATFMAAGVGNALYHFIRDIHFVAEMGWRQAALSYTSYLFYCFMLALGIGVSQARINAGRKPAATRAGALHSIVCVWTYFICLQVFGDETRRFPFQDRLSFFTSLFGISSWTT